MMYISLQCATEMEFYGKVKRKNYHYSHRDSPEGQFVKACKQGDIDMVKHHIRRGTNAQTFVYRTTTLLAACIFNRWRIVKLLLKVTNPCIRGYDGMTPYMSACERRYYSIVQILGNDARVNPHNGRNFLKCPEVRPCIVKAKNFDANTTIYGKTLLSQLCHKYYEDEDGVRLLLSVGADPNLADENDITPLMGAAQGKAKSLKLLLESGADVYRVSKKGHTAFTQACQHHEYGCAVILLRHGACVYDTYDGKDMLALLDVKSQYYRGKTWFRERIRKEMKKVEKWHVALLQLPTDVLRIIGGFI